jgi:hypothetical protein
LVSALKENDNSSDAGDRRRARLIALVISESPADNQAWMEAGVHSTLPKPPSMAQIKQALT